MEEHENLKQELKIFGSHVWVCVWVCVFFFLEVEFRLLTKLENEKKWVCCFSLNFEKCLIE